MAASGYSGTPLHRKLGIKPGFRVCIVNSPFEYWRKLDLMDGSIVESEGGDLDLIHLFVDKEQPLMHSLLSLKQRLNPKGMIWVSWVKKSSKKHCGVSGNYIREEGLRAGLVDIKVASIDQDWSGLKFVIPVKDRK